MLCSTDKRYTGNEVAVGTLELLLSNMSDDLIKLEENRIDKGKIVEKQ